MKTTGLSERCPTVKVPSCFWTAALATLRGTLTGLVARETEAIGVPLYLTRLPCVSSRERD
jgi:hypothetical protein